MSIVPFHRPEPSPLARNVIVIQAAKELYDAWALLELVPTPWEQLSPVIKQRWIDLTFETLRDFKEQP